MEKPVNLATGCLRWCLRPVFAARSFLMSFLRAARDDAGGVALHLGRPLSEYTAKYRFRLRQLEQNIRGF